MKQLLLMVLAASLIISCNNEKTSGAKTGDIKNDSSMDNIAYPYKAEYPADFKMGDATYSKTVLDFCKCWEDNRMDDMKALLNDSVWVRFSDGSSFNGKADSLISSGKQYRAMYASVRSVMDTWIPVHNNQKNEDWVLLWGKDYTTDTKGKVDSTGSHSYWQIKNSKIAGWAEFTEQLAPPPPPPPKKG
jgi:hypothetical protein